MSNYSNVYNDIRDLRYKKQRAILIKTLFKYIIKNKFHPLFLEFNMIVKLGDQLI